MARHNRTKLIQPIDIVSDMADLLDLAGIDAVDKHHLDRVLHAGNCAENMLAFAEGLSRSTAKRVTYAEMIESYLSRDKS